MSFYFIQGNKRPDKTHLRALAGNNSPGLRRIWVRLQGTSAGAYQGAGGCNAVDGRKDKQGG
ncbi:MAG: hypothetical protein PVJ84_08920, partial [Desulfobacteraceae bacterium]